MKSRFRILIIALVLSYWPNILHAQSTDPTSLSKNHIFMGVSVGLVSQAAVNYERKIYSGEKISWYGRLGAGGSALFWTNEGLGGLAAITMLTGKGNGHFEFSAGGFIGGGYETFINLVLNVGYRYQKPNRGFIFRTFAGPVAIGIGAGYAF